MNYDEISKQFYEKLDYFRINEEEIKSRKGNESCLITTEKFKQIYAPEDSGERNAYVRCEISPYYFFSEQNGILLRFDKKGNIYLVENRDKKSRRKLYKFKLNKSGGYKNLRDYQLSALIFGSDMTEKAEVLLNEKGIKAIDKSKGVDVHHKEKNDDCNKSGLLMATNTEHKILHRDIPSDDIKLVQYLLDVSKAFDGNENNTIIIPCGKKEKLHSDIISEKNIEFEEFIRTDMLNNMKFEAAQLIILNDEIVKVVTTESGAKCLLSLDNQIKTDISSEVVNKLFKEG